MPTKCPKCNGAGELYHAPLTGRDGQYADEEWEPCPSCGGVGAVEEGQCDLCGEEGKVVDVATPDAAGSMVTLTLCAQCALQEARDNAMPAPDGPRKHGIARMYR